MRLACLLVLSLALFGCGGSSEPRRVAVDGAVIVGETVIGEATVRFLPEPGNSGPVVATSVVDGLYRFSQLDGPYPGKYKVLVNLELGAISKLATERPNEPPPPTNWEVLVTVPDQESATQHLVWKGASEATRPRTSKDGLSTKADRSEKSAGHKSSGP
jgi:hypothetical protein